MHYGTSWCSLKLMATFTVLFVRILYNAYIKRPKFAFHVTRLKLQDKRAKQNCKPIEIAYNLRFYFFVLYN